MATFICKVLTPQGQIVKLKINEKDKITCLKKLKRNGMVPIEVKKSIKLFSKERKSRSLSFNIYSSQKRKLKAKQEQVIQISNRVSLEELKEFTKTFYLLKQTNFTNSHALSTIINNTKNIYFKECLINILKDVEKGKHMYRAMKEQKKVFPMIYVNFIKTGELTGVLEDSLKYAITYLEDEEKIKNKVTNVLIPNIILFIGIIVFIFGAILIGIPNLRLLAISNSNIMTIPKITQTVANVLEVLTKLWYIWFILVAIGACIFIHFISTDKGRFKFDKFKYNTILFGKTMYLVDFTRIIRSIFLNLQNKMRIEDALEISKNVTPNTYMQNTIEKSISNLYIGKSWIEPFEEDKILSSITIELLKKGFKANDIETIERTIEYLDKKIEEEIDKLLKKILEISYIIVGIALLLFIAIVFVPYIQIFLSQLLFI